MARLSADLSAQQGMAVYDKDQYTCHVHKTAVGASKSNPKADQITVMWKPEGEKAGDNPATVQDYVQYGGKNKDGDPVDTTKLCQYINELKLGYTCRACGGDFNAATTPLIEEKGKFFCPKCGSRAAIDFDHPDEWVGKRAKLNIDVGKMPNSDEPNNNVRGRIRAI